MAAGDIANKFPNLAVGQPRTYDGTLTWDLDARVLKDMSVPNVIHRLDQAVPGAPILGFTNRVSGPKTVNQVGQGLEYFVDLHLAQFDPRSGQAPD